jgi:hypothetical protein
LAIVPTVVLVATTVYRKIDKTIHAPKAIYAAAGSESAWAGTHSAGSFPAANAPWKAAIDATVSAVSGTNHG